MADFNIPDEFKSELELVAAPNTRPDEEILASLRQHVPVTSEKNIWTFWHAGLDAMPKWCQRNVVDWVRICGPSWTVRVLDVVPGSLNHALNFASAELLPEAFIKGSMDGPYVGPHSADFLRGALLFQHGGVAMDVGCILVRSLDRMCWDKIADPRSPYEVAVPVMYGQTIANHFVASKKGSPFIENWHKLFIHLWENRNNHEGISQNPLMGFVKDISFEESADWAWDFKIGPVQVMEYIAQVMCWRRLTMLEDTGDGFNASEYWQTRVLATDAGEEHWGAELVVGFCGTRIYELLKLRRDVDPESEDYKEAYKLVWRLLAKSSLQKVTHGKGMTHTPHLGKLWDDNEGTDCASGTFGELLRWGTVHLRQKRESIRTKETVKSPLILKEGLLGSLKP